MVHGGFGVVAVVFRRAPGLEDAPFLSSEWLGALEETGCAVADRGWVPHHLVVSQGGAPIAVAPAYLKLNSEGEFVFDHGGRAQRGGQGSRTTRSCWSRCRSLPRRASAS